MAELFLRPLSGCHLFKKDRAMEVVNSLDFNPSLMSAS
jgi:hypothetical protein